MQHGRSSGTIHGRVRKDSQALTAGMQTTCRSFFCANHLSSVSDAAGAIEVQQGARLWEIRLALVQRSGPHSMGYKPLGIPDPTVAWAGSWTKKNPTTTKRTAGQNGPP